MAATIRLTTVAFRHTGTATTELVAATAGKRVYVVHFSFSPTAATALPEFRDGTSNTTLVGPWDSTSDVNMNGTREAYLFATSVGEPLDFFTAGAGNVGGFVTYFTSD